MGKDRKKSVKKPKAKCCGKFKKKSKFCSRCPVALMDECRLATRRAEIGKKQKEEKKRKKKDKKKVKKRK